MVDGTKTTNKSGVQNKSSDPGGSLDSSNSNENRMEFPIINVDMDALYCDVDMEDESPSNSRSPPISGLVQPRTKTNDTNATKLQAFEYPSKNTKKSDVDMDELYCDVDEIEENPTNSRSPLTSGSPQPKTKTNDTNATKLQAFEYPSKEAKKIDVDMGDLYCDVDIVEKKRSNSRSSPISELVQPKTKTTYANANATKLQAFHYPSKEANKIDVDMDELYCDVDEKQENPTESELPPTKVTNRNVTKLQAFEYPSKEAKKGISDVATVTATVTAPQRNSAPFKYPSKEAKQNSTATDVSLEESSVPSFKSAQNNENAIVSFENAYPSKEAKRDRSKEPSSIVSSLSNSKSASTKGSISEGNKSTALNLTAPTHRTNRRRNRRDYDSDDDGEGEHDTDDVNRSNTSDGKNGSLRSNNNTSSPLKYDNLTHRMKSRMNRRRRSRRDYGSDDDGGDSDSCSSETDNRAQRSSGVTLNSEIYNSVGAVAVYSTGVVSQRPAVLTQSSQQGLKLQFHPEEEDEAIKAKDEESPVTQVGIHAAKAERASKELGRTSIPFGDHDESFDRMQQINGGDAFIDATVESPPSRAVGVTGASGRGKKKPNDAIFFENDEDEEKSVDLPCYWSPFLWAMVAVLIVALGVIIAVVVIVGDKEPKPDPTLPPIVVPLDQIKVEAFERHIGGILSTISGPQLLAYDWLITEDETTNFSESMSQDDIGIMKTRYILAVFYYALGGDNWFDSGLWLESSYGHCQWQFVDCRPIGENFAPDVPFPPVTAIQIKENNLKGSLPSELSHLSSLEWLVLKGNWIESVKAFENGLDSLKWVVLNENPLQDHEYLFRLTNLQTLHLSKTNFSGTLPVETRQLSNMQSLDLSGNSLHGPLASRFQTMSNLRDLDLNDNRFNSTLEEILDCGDCTSTLTTFESTQNPLTGSIPDRLFDFLQLSTFSVAKSKLTGTIPSDIGRLTLLKTLYLYENFYFSETNRLPSEIGKLDLLERLSVSNSVVGGTVPEEFANLSSLQTLGIGRTSQTGSIPEGMCEIAGLENILHSPGMNCSCSGDVCELTILTPDSGS